MIVLYLIVVRCGNAVTIKVLLNEIARIKSVAKVDSEVEKSANASVDLPGQ
uniref:Uncharacterized protein n=1 Tax=Amphimedon queenslandica TaxID=400682 RepID=A0A1X7SNQ3_AMPQE